MLDDPQDEGRMLPSTPNTPLVTDTEVNMQIATAHRYPRSVKSFRDEVLAMATLNEDVAAECSYALERTDKNGQKKVIVGPSARFAEIVASAWGNCRAGARVIDDRGNFVTAQGAFIDLQRNTAVTFEVQRSIVSSGNRRYSNDMIAVTGNAACSIALRNAVFKGVPKAFWGDLWERTREAAIGDAKMLAKRRANAVRKFGEFGVTEAQLLAKLDRPSLDDVTPDDLGTLLGYLTSLRDGDTTPEQLFADEHAEAANEAVADLNAGIKAGKGSKAKAGKDDMVMAYADVRAALDRGVGDDEAFASARDLIRFVPNDGQRKELETYAQQLLNGTAPASADGTGSK